MPSELKYLIVSVLLTFIPALPFQFAARMRVLSLPFAFVAILVALFWSARVSAEREDESENER